MLEQRRVEKLIKTPMNIQSQVYSQIEIMCFYWKLSKKLKRRKVDLQHSELRLDCVAYNYVLDIHT